VSFLGQKDIIEGTGVDPDSGVNSKNFIEDEVDCLVALSIENDTWSIFTALLYKAAKVWGRPVVLRVFWILGLRPR